MDFHVTVSTHS